MAMLFCQGKKKQREDWAKTKLANCQKKKHKGSTHRHIDISRGRYKLPFKILEDQGGANDPEAVKGFKNIITKCIKMGYPFVKRQWQSKRFQFLEFEEEVNNQFENSWSIFESEFETSHVGPIMEDPTDGTDPVGAPRASMLYDGPQGSSYPLPEEQEEVQQGSEVAVDPESIWQNAINVGDGSNIDGQPLEDEEAKICNAYVGLSETVNTQVDQGKPKDKEEPKESAKGGAKGKDGIVGKGKDAKGKDAKGKDAKGKDAKGKSGKGGAPKAEASGKAEQPPKASGKPKPKPKPGNGKRVLQDGAEENPEKIAKTAAVLYARAITGAESMLDEIANSDRWSFSKDYGPSFTKGLQDARQSLKDYPTYFQKEFMSREFKVLKEQYDENELKVAMKTFEDLMPGIKWVESEKNKLLGMLKSHEDSLKEQ